MKVTTSETKDFTPFELTIKIESLDELKVLWAHLNNPQPMVINNLVSAYEWLEDVQNCDEAMTAVWNVLNNKLIQLGVKQ